MIKVKCNNFRLGLFVICKKRPILALFMPFQGLYNIFLQVMRNMQEKDKWFCIKQKQVKYEHCIVLCKVPWLRFLCKNRISEVPKRKWNHCIEISLRLPRRRQEWSPPRKRCMRLLVSIVINKFCSGFYFLISLGVIFEETAKNVNFISE